MLKKNQGQDSKAILIFPAGMPKSLEFLERCQREGRAVIGSSSLAYDVSKERYPSWVFLPYINDPGFDLALKEVIDNQGIAGIYCPNPVAWSHINRELEKIDSEVRLVNDWPVNEELSSYRSAIALAQKASETPLEVASSLNKKPSISPLKLASLFRHANAIPGMCDNEKIRALCDIFRFAPRGDVVEIGCAWGKSAFVLACLARIYGIGNTLCIDPWKADFAVQRDEGGLVDSGIADYDLDEMATIYEMNLLPYAAGDVNYLRMPSTEAVLYYGEGCKVNSKSFGVTTYTGGIAVLHVDGNHSYDAAKADVGAWSKYLVPGGWLIIDDYVWPFGDGPQRVADIFLKENKQRIVCCFVMGTALFMQLY